MYADYEQALENEDYADASLLEARANRLFQEADSILSSNAKLIMYLLSQTDFGKSGDKSGVSGA